MDPLSPADVVHLFARWLCRRSIPVAFGSGHANEPAQEAAQAFCDELDLGLPGTAGGAAGAAQGAEVDPVAAGTDASPADASVVAPGAEEDLVSPPTRSGVVL